MKATNKLGKNKRADAPGIEEIVKWAIIIGLGIIVLSIFIPQLREALVAGFKKITSIFLI